MIGNVELIVRLVLAALLGAAVGFEREYYGKAAGFRTHALVCTGSALMMIVSIYVFETFRSYGGGGDPSRIAAQVVSGIGFLGAGTIIRYGATVKGLTTAASLWAVAGIGLACGSGFYQGAVLTAVLVFIILLVLSKFEKKFISRKALDSEVEAQEKSPG